MLIMLMSAAGCSPAGDEQDTGGEFTESEVNAAGTYLLENTPEISAFARYLDEVSGGKVSLLLQPRPFPGEGGGLPDMDCFVFYIGENQPGCIVDWSWFAVARDLGEVYHVETESGEFETLEEWRIKEGYPRYLHGRIGSEQSGEISGASYAVQHENSEGQYTVTIMRDSAQRSTLLLFDAWFRMRQSIDLGVVTGEVDLFDVNSDGFTDIVIGAEGVSPMLYLWDESSKNYIKNVFPFD